MFAKDLENRSEKRLLRLEEDGALPLPDIFKSLQAMKNSFFFSEKGGRFQVIGLVPKRSLVLAKRHLAQQLEEIEGVAGGESLEDLPFTGGAVGVFNFELAYVLNHLDALVEEDEPLGFVHIFDDVIVVDRLLGKTHYLVNVDDGEVGDPRQRLAYLKKRVRALARRPFSDGYRAVRNAVDGNAKFTEMIDRVKQELHRGNLFQCVVAEQRTALVDGEDVALLEKLMAENGQAFVFYIKNGDETVIGASPERLVKVDSSGRMSTNPIAGTRRRGRTLAEDDKLARELLACEKERAEHLMLVDLARNDLAKVCTPGSVEVSEYQNLVKYEHLMHLVSTVEGRLAEGQTPLQSLLACFPAGTLSGAPKREALLNIRKLEKAKRETYGGCLFLQDYNGALDSVITIRHLVRRESQVRYGVGAGIVLDSIAEDEIKEINNKAATIETVLFGGRNVSADR